jgi:hypothetical protein
MGNVGVRGSATELMTVLKENRHLEISAVSGHDRTTQTPGSWATVPIGRA